ncbi:MAG TPA: HlyD family efflux transporter periplasmic adaptor subunit [Thermoanaerobaculia bacterium]|nr:HlyD family efflux transporter periplasmic adaptor subunit [Thermoanaerobaculia bacterium]
MAGLLLAGACARPPAVPTLRLVPRPFVHKVTAEGWLAAETVTPVTVPPQVKAAVRLAWLAPDASQVSAGDVIARFDGGELQARLDTARSAFDGAGFRIVENESESVAERAGLLSELEKARLELALARQFQKRDAEVWSRHEIITAQIDEDLARDRQHHAEEKGATQRRRATSDLDLLAIEQSQAQRKIGEARAGLASLQLPAPHGGLFMRARDWRGEPLEVGAQLWRGAPVGEIPDLARMQARVFVLEADAGGVAAGQVAEVVLENRPEVAHRGKVARVDTVAKPREQGSPVQYFEVTVALAATDGAVMKPGQRVRATLFLAREARVLVVPRQAVERVGERHRVFVRRGERFVPTTVELGVGNHGLVVVTKGLAAGDVIALRSPEGPPETASPKGAAAGQRRTAAAPSAGRGGAGAP